MARIRKNERNGPGLLFILVTLVVVAVVGARFFGFYPDSDDNGGLPESSQMEEPPVAPGPTLDPTPKILVFHSHSSENYQPNESHTIGNNPGDIIGVGKAFVEKLNSLGITAIHDTTHHDKPRYSEAFINSDRMVEETLQEHTEIQMVLDLHRDGLQDKPDDYTRVQVDGVDVAKILFIVGDKDNDKVEENLAFAQKISDALESQYPGVSRGVRVFKSDYSGELHENSVMVLIGDWRGNNLDEAVLSARLLAEVLVPLLD